jgi:hypothetical protein
VASGLELARRLHGLAEPTPAPVILISTHAEQDYGEPPRSWLSTAPACPGAGFTHVALVPVGTDPQERFITWAAAQLLPVLRTA